MYTENFYFVFINPPDITIPIQYLCQLVDTVLLPTEVRGGFSPSL